MSNNHIRFIDLFAGLGGIRLGFENSFHKFGFSTECVMTSEIKPYANNNLKHNFNHDYFVGDIFKVKNEDIPDFDFLLGGFPCQPFSTGGKRHGFSDTRGTLFFEIERILRSKQPYGFILENVEGLVRHDLKDKKDKIGNTLQTIINKLENELNYKVTWKILDSIDFGLPQSRKRVFIVGTKNETVDLNFDQQNFNTLGSILEQGLDTMKTDFVDKLLNKYTVDELVGKSIKDKRGGKNNIHSWDFGLKGNVSNEQIKLLNLLFKERRKKHWADEIGIDWMDGMALTLQQISTFFTTSKDLKSLLDDLVYKGYLRFEHPKRLVKETIDNRVKAYREYDYSKPKGYNIVTGKLSFEINKILDPDDIAPTLVATDISRLAVPDGSGLRKLTVREGLRLFGYPEWYEIISNESEAFDLLGNTVAVPVVDHVAERLAKAYLKFNSFQESEKIMAYQ